MSKIKVLADLDSSKASFNVLQIASFSLRLHQSSLPMLSVSKSSFLVRTPVILNQGLL